nr:basic proline-rich protein-like [Loxodonta africana]
MGGDGPSSVKKVFSSHLRGCLGGAGSPSRCPSPCAQATDRGSQAEPPLLPARCGGRGPPAPRWGRAPPFACRGPRLPPASRGRAFAGPAVWRRGRARPCVRVSVRPSRRAPGAVGPGVRPADGPRAVVCRLPPAPVPCRQRCAGVQAHLLTRELSRRCAPGPGGWACRGPPPQRLPRRRRSTPPRPAGPRTRRPRSGTANRPRRVGRRHRASPAGGVPWRRALGPGPGPCVRRAGGRRVAVVRVRVARWVGGGLEETGSGGDRGGVRSPSAPPPPPPPSRCPRLPRRRRPALASPRPSGCWLGAAPPASAYRFPVPRWWSPAPRPPAVSCRWGGSPGAASLLPGPVRASEGRRAPAGRAGLGRPPAPRVPGGRHRGPLSRVSAVGLRRAGAARAPGRQRPRPCLRGGPREKPAPSPAVREGPLPARARTHARPRATARSRSLARPPARTGPNERAPRLPG